MDRRQFLLASAAGGGLALLGGLTLPRTAHAADLYGPLLDPDRNGVRLPSGFTSRIVAQTGSPVGATGYLWHPNPDGGATFATDDGGWIYVSNDEANNGAGGVSMLRFDASARIVDAKSILSGTNRNCAGGPTPWGTWLSCEEVDDGRVWECDPLGERQATVHPAMGVFKHEAAACDPVNEVVYLTEDKGDSALYRFVPERWGDVSTGELQVLTESNRQLRWATIPDPEARSAPTRNQVPQTKRFDGGEGAWYDNGSVYFTTKGDNRVWQYETEPNQLTVIYDMATSPTPVLSGVDNITVSAAGDLYVCEDGGNMEVVVLSSDGGVQPFLRFDIDGSEVTGVAFDPSGTRMYVSSQRNPGTTYEISGPFRGGQITEPEPKPASAKTETAPGASGFATGTNGGIR